MEKKGSDDMANIKYVRVSTKEQNEARQLHDSNNYDKLYIEKASGKNTNREQLKTMLAYVREGDTLTVESYSRLARNTHDLLEIIEQLNAKGVTLISQKEGINTSTAAGKLMLTIFAGLAQFERECLLERQAEGIAVAKAQGKQIGRKKKETPKQFFDIVKLWKDEKMTATQAMKELGMTKTLFYKTVKQYSV